MVLNLVDCTLEKKSRLSFFHQFQPEMILKKAVSLKKSFFLLTNTVKRVREETSKNRSFLPYITNELCIYREMKLHRRLVFVNN